MHQRKEPFNPMLTPSKQGIFRPLKAAAWRAHCARSNIVLVHDKIAEDRWYRQTLVTQCGIYTTKEIAGNDASAFDALCLCFATIAGDETQIEYWARATERRALWQLKQNMSKANVTREYIESIAVRMGFIQEGGNMAIEDLPAELILKINTALFMHNRRRQSHAA